MPEVIGEITKTIIKGLPGPEGGVRDLLQALFTERYHQRHREQTIIRDAYKLATTGEDEGVPYAGLINADNPPSGPYGGTSIVWFPSQDNGGLIGLNVGTRGISPDEGILMRPGHRRRIVALRRYLARLGVEAWSKPDPAALGVEVPQVSRDRFPGFEKVFKRYGKEMYCHALVPKDQAIAEKVVRAFFDLYAYERGWQIRSSFQGEYDEFLGALREDLFPAVDASQVYEILQNRRFVVLQGPPGTGKTRMAELVKRDYFAGIGMTVQFHPGVTYEDFIVGLSPDPHNESLHFGVRKGWLLEAASASKSKPFLLVIDEVNRADLGKVLGEAIYLFESDEIEKENNRIVNLPHSIDGQKTFTYPKNLFILCTMNTADRSIAGMDIAVRRRFAFLTMPPDRSVVAAQGLPLAIDFFDRLIDLFVEHAPQDALDLVPGHAYFLSDNEDVLKKRFKHELVPLLEEYLRGGYLGPASTELHALKDALEDVVS